MAYPGFEKARKDSDARRERQPIRRCNRGGGSGRPRADRFPCRRRPL